MHELPGDGNPDRRRRRTPPRRPASGIGIGIGIVDKRARDVDVAAMDLDDASSRPDDVLDRLVRQDLDPLSVGELEARVTVLTGEIARVRLKIAHAVHHRAGADALFK